METRVESKQNMSKQEGISQKSHCKKGERKTWSCQSQEICNNWNIETSCPSRAPSLDKRPLLLDSVQSGTKKHKSARALTSDMRRHHNVSRQPINWRMVRGWSRLQWPTWKQNLTCQHHAGHLAWTIRGACCYEKCTILWWFHSCMVPWRKFNLVARVVTLGKSSYLHKSQMADLGRQQNATCFYQST